MRKGQRLIAGLASFLVGAGLLATALWAVASNPQAVDGLRGALAAPPIQLLLALPLLVVATVILTAGTMRAITAIWHPLPLGEMVLLMASSTLLNYLPLKPALVGRAAYLNIIHRIPVKTTVLVLVLVTAVSATVALLLGSFVAAEIRWGWQWWALALGLLGGLLAASATRPSGVSRFVLQALIWRFVEVLTWAARLWICFQMVGHPIDFRMAIAGGVVSTLVGMIPLAPGGLGLREWSIGLLGPALHAYELDVGLAADLLNRAADLLVIIPWGGWASMVAARRLQSTGWTGQNSRRE